MTLTLLILSALLVFEKVSVSRKVSKSMSLIDSILAYIGLFFVTVGSFTYELEVVGPVLAIGFIILGAAAVGLGTSIKVDKKLDYVMIGLGVLLLIPFANYVGAFLLALYLLIIKSKEKGAAAYVLGVALLVSIVAMLLKSVELASFVMIVFIVLVKITHLETLISMLRHVGTNVVTDVLTGLFNRRWMFKQLEKLIEKNREAGVIFIDIDNFKNLNDTKGHDYGDEVLRKIGEILRQEAGSSAWGVRYGGEELVVLVSKEVRTEPLAKKILERVRKELNVTLSIGVALLDEQDLTSAQMIKIADERMYYSKNNGKNQITLGEAKPSAAEGELKDA